MNVTLKLPDDLYQAAKHRAAEEYKSLSAWLAALVRRELIQPDQKPLCWMDAFSGDQNDKFLDRDFPLEDRKGIEVREWPLSELWEISRQALR